jgi:hypothetical protein
MYNPSGIAKLKILPIIVLGVHFFDGLVQRKATYPSQPGRLSCKERISTTSESFKRLD